MYLQAGLVHLVLPPQVAAGVVTESDESWWSTTVGHIARTTLAFGLATNAVAAQQSYADEVIVTSAATFVEDDYNWPVVFAPKGINNVVFIPADSDDIVTAVVLPDLGDYIVQEIDGVSRFVLEDGSGAILLEVQPSPIEEDYWQNRVRPVSSTFIVPQPWNFDQNEPSGTLGTAPPEEDYWQNGVLPVGQTFKQPIWWEQEDVTPTILPPEEDFWQNSVKPVPGINNPPVQWGFDQNEPSGTLGTAPPEEDLTPVFVPAWGKYTLFSTIDEDLPIASVQTIDEEYWQNSVKPVWLTFVVPQPWLFEQNEPSGTLGTVPPEEDYWLSLIQPRMATAPAAVFVDEDLPVTPVQVVDEEYGIPVIPPRQLIVSKPAFAVDDDLSVVTATISVDEEHGVPVIPPRQLITSNPAFASDDEVVRPLGVEEEHPYAVILPFPRIVYPPAINADDDIVPIPSGLDETELGWPTTIRPVSPVVVIRSNLPGLSQSGDSDEYSYPPSIKVWEEERSAPVIIKPWPKVPLRAITVDDEIVKPLRVDESDWFAPRPWVLRKSPLVFWQEYPVELPQQLLSGPVICFATAYNCTSAAAPACVEITEISVISVQVIPNKLLVVDNSCIITAVPVPYPVPPPDSPTTAPAAATLILWLEADSGVVTQNLEFRGFAL